LTLQKVSQIFTKILLIGLRYKLFYIVLLAFFLTIKNQAVFGQEIKAADSLKLTNTTSSLPKNTSIDTVKINSNKDGIIKNDSIKKKPLLESKVNRKAKDYEKIDQKKKQITLYNQAELYYTDIELKSGIIVFDYDKDEVYAGRIKDSTGKYTQYPVFKQGTNVIEPDSIRFNFKTKKALIWNSRTNQGEMNIKAEVTKRENDSTYFMKSARITTSKNVDDPEYYFLVRQVKFTPKKKVVAGLTNLYIADVPTPIGLPFAYFPMTEESLSGFIMPTPGQSNRQGYFLQNGGYYFALSDYYDLAILGDYFTNGSYALRGESTYAKRYKFNGRVNLRFENNIESERGFPDYAVSRQYNIQWTHNQDAKAAANSRFGASVNLGSSQFFRQSLNLANVGATLNNNLSSSISYSKTIDLESVPQINFSLSATHNQNTNTQQINMTLPTLQASVDRIFPFASGDGARKGFIKNINFQYNLRGENRITTTDSLFFKPQMFRNSNTGFQHSIPLSTNFKIFKYFSVSSSVNYTETWTLNTINKSFNSLENRVVTEDIKGFDSYRTYDFNANIGTTIYGTFDFGEDKKIQSIRHVMRPSVSYSYLPSFDQYYDTYTIDATGNNVESFTRFQNSIFGAPSQNFASNLGFSLSNTFEAKVRDKESKKGEPKKIMLLNNFNISSTYNLAADSLKLSPFRVTGGTLLFKDKMNVNFGATLDPYAIDNSGRRINVLNSNNNGSLFRMTSANLTINYSITSKELKGTADPKDSNNQGLQNGGREDDLFGRALDLNDRRKSMFDEKDDTEETNNEWYNFELPWDLQFAYSLTYGNNNRQNEITSQSIMFSGNIDLAPRWKVGLSSGYDFAQNGITFTQFRFERDLESWRMNFDWVPYGPNAFWGFFIGIRSTALSDIKWEKRNVPDRVFR